MNSTGFISQFNTITPKQPIQHSTARCQSDGRTSTSSCRFCQQILSKLTEFRKRQILLQLQTQKLKQQITIIKRQKQQLINTRILTYSQYQKKMQATGQQIWNRQDLQAELFEAKVIIELLLTSKKTQHPQLKIYDNQSLKNKYSQILIENLRLQEKVMVRDRIIEERSFLPIYHYDQRVTGLRKAMIYWYRNAEQNCSKMKMRCNNMRKEMSQMIENIREEMITEFNNNRQVIQNLMHHTALTKAKKLPLEQKQKIKASKAHSKKNTIDRSSRSITQIR